MSECIHGMQEAWCATCKDSECGAILSRYNRDDECAPCMARRLNGLGRPRQKTEPSPVPGPAPIPEPLPAPPPNPPPRHRSPRLPKACEGCGRPRRGRRPRDGRCPRCRHRSTVTAHPACHRCGGLTKKVVGRALYRCAWERGVCGFYWYDGRGVERFQRAVTDPEGNEAHGFRPQDQPGVERHRDARRSLHGRR